MTWVLLSFLILAALLLAALVWALRGIAASPDTPNPPALPAEPGQIHTIHFSQVRQLLSSDDLDFLTSKCSPRLAKYVRRDRRLITLDYLDALHRDFRGLLQLARALATLSPEVALQDERERFWLAVRFECRYAVTRALLLLGLSPLPQLRRMIQMVGSLGLRLDTTLARLGEHLVRTPGLASPVDRSGMNLP